MFSRFRYSFFSCLFSRSFFAFFSFFLFLPVFAATETLDFNFTYPGQTIQYSRVKSLPCTITYAVPYGFIAGVVDCSRVTWQAAYQEDIYIYQQTISEDQTGFLNQPFYAQAPGYFATGARSVTITVQYVGDPPVDNPSGGDSGSGSGSSDTNITSIANNTSTIANNSTTIANNSTTTATNTTTISNNTTSIKNTVNSMQSDLSSIKSDVNSMESDVSSMKSDISSMSDVLSQIKTLFQLLGITVSELNTNVITIRNNTETINNNVNLAKNYLSHILGYVRDSVMPNVETIKNDTSDIKTKVTSIDTHVTSIDTNVSSLDQVLRIIRLYLKDNIIPDLHQIKEDQKALKDKLTSGDAPAAPQRVTTIAPTSTPIQQIKAKLLPNFSFFDSSEMKPYEITFSFEFPFAPSFGEHGTTFTLPFTGLQNANNGHMLLPQSLCTAFDTFIELFRILLLVLMAWAFLKVCLTVLRQW